MFRLCWFWDLFVDVALTGNKSQNKVQELYHVIPSLTLILIYLLSGYFISGFPLYRTMESLHNSTLHLGALNLLLSTDQILKSTCILRLAPYHALQLLDVTLLHDFAGPLLHSHLLYLYWPDFRRLRQRGSEHRH